MNAFSLSGLLIMTVCIGLGAFVLYKCTDRRLGLIWFLSNIAVAMWGALCFFNSMTSTPSRVLWLWRFTWGFGVVWIPSLHFHFVCRLCGLERKRPIQLNYVFAALFFMAWRSPLIYHGIRWTFGSFYYGTAGLLYPIFLIWWGALAIYIHLLLYQELRHATPQIKNRLRYYMISSAIGYTGGSFCFLPVFGIDIYPWANYAIFLYLLIMTYAILRHQLLDITVVFRKTLVYSMLTALLTAIYVGVLAFLAHGVEKWGHISNVYSSAIAAAVIALLFHPLSTRMQHWVDRQFPREKLDPHLLREAAGGFAHEMKHPLSKISLPAELSMNDLLDVKNGRKHFDEVFPRVMDHMEFIMGQAADASNLIESIRELAAPNALPAEPVDLRECLEEVLRTEHTRLEKEEIAVTLTWPKTRPLALGRARQAKIILLNLIRNAIEAMTDSNVRPPHQLSITVTSNDHWLELMIRDTGKGLSDEARAKLFHPHFTTKGSRGTGLGLYLSHQLAQSCGGSLQGMPAPEGGAQFLLRLPIYKT